MVITDDNKPGKKKPQDDEDEDEDEEVEVSCKTDSLEFSIYTKCVTKTKYLIVTPLGRLL